MHDLLVKKYTVALYIDKNSVLYVNDFFNKILLFKRIFCILFSFDSFKSFENICHNIFGFEILNPINISKDNLLFQDIKNKIICLRNLKELICDRNIYSYTRNTVKNIFNEIGTNDDKIFEFINDFYQDNVLLRIKIIKLCAFYNLSIKIILMHLDLIHPNFRILNNLSFDKLFSKRKYLKG